MSATGSLCLRVPKKIFALPRLCVLKKGLKKVSLLHFKIGRFAPRKWRFRPSKVPLSHAKTASFAAFSWAVFGSFLEKNGQKTFSQSPESGQNLWKSVCESAILTYVKRVYMTMNSHFFRRTKVLIIYIFLSIGTGEMRYCERNVALSGGKIYFTKKLPRLTWEVRISQKRGVQMVLKICK